MTLTGIWHYGRVSPLFYGQVKNFPNVKFVPEIVTLVHPPFEMLDPPLQIVGMVIIGDTYITGDVQNVGGPVSKTFKPIFHQEQCSLWVANARR